MTTIDQILLNITSYTSPCIEEKISQRDCRVLRGLATTVSSKAFITENQSRLLLKLLNQYSVFLSTIEPNLKKYLETPVWSAPFRIVDVVKKVYINTTVDHENRIFIEHSHSLNLRKIIQNLSKRIEGSVLQPSTRYYSFELTEKNIDEIVTTLTPYKFDFDQKITDFHQIIKNWQFQDQCKNLIFGENLFESIKNSLAKEQISDEITNNNIVYDRSTRYHYFVKKPEKISENLENLIIHRTQQKIWVNSKEHELENLIGNLKNLNRFPVLVIFDSRNPDQCVDHLKNLNFALEKHDINNRVGIYFRLDSLGQGKDFNQFISSKQYNTPLDSTTLVAGVQTGKLPKFFVKDCDWEPKSVIVMGTNLRHSKTAVYSNRCDLIISYSDKESLFDQTTGWAINTWAL
jgi:hypothetical protein